MGKLLARFAVLFCAAALCAVVLEGAAGALFPAASGFFIWPPFLEETFFPDQAIMPGTSPQAWFRTDSLGLRSYEPAPNDDYRILVLGGSAAECLYLTQRDTWPRRIAALLHQARPGIRAWIGNGGRSGQTTRDHVFHVEYLPLKEMDIDAIVIMAGVNDLLLRLRRGEYYDPDYLRNPDSAETQIDHAFLMVPPSYSIPPPPFWRRTALWRAAKRIRNRIFQPPPQDPHGEVVRLWRDRRTQAGEYIDALPPMVEAHREFIANLDRIVQYAARKDYRLILTTQPALWKPKMTAEETAALWMGGVGNFKSAPGQSYYTPAALARGLDGYNRLLKDYCLWRGVECIDLAQGFPRDLDHFYDDCHFTVEGADLVARIIAGYFLQGPPWTREDEEL